MNNREWALTEEALLLHFGHFSRILEERTIYIDKGAIEVLASFYLLITIMRIDQSIVSELFG